MDSCAVDHPDEVGRRLGHDLFRFQARQTTGRLPRSIAEGWAEAERRGVAPGPADRYTRKWLQLRLNAHRRERIVDPAVTPPYLAEIDVAACPVLRVALTHGERIASDWSIDRLNNDGAYAPGNLAVISTAANRAKGGRTFDDVLALSTAGRTTDGLRAEEWLRMAAIMHGPCFASHPRAAPLIPLVAPIPLHTARTGAQLIQHAFTERARTLSGMNLLVRTFRTIGADPHARSHLEHFAFALHRGLAQVDVPWDVWLRPDVMNGLCAWRTSLSISHWAVAGEIAMRLSAADRVAPRRIGAWHLQRTGHHR